MKRIIYVAGDGVALPDRRVFLRGVPQEVEAREAEAFVATGAFVYADEERPEPRNPKRGGEK